jgi:uncharacterized membrane protein HdeD (DUF308 family)
MTAEVSGETALAAEPAVPWWLVLIEGIFAILIGILLLTNTAVTTAILIQVVGIYWFISGILGIVSIFIDSTAWGWKLIVGILGIIAGILVIQHPLWSTALVTATVVIILGIEGLIIGGINIVRAFRGAGWGVGILGALSIVFGIILLANTLIAAATLPIVLGIFGIVGGLLAIIMAFRMR